jgi:hypothetical protein
MPLVLPSLTVTITNTVVIVNAVQHHIHLIWEELINTLPQDSVVWNAICKNKLNLDGERTE